MEKNKPEEPGQIPGNRYLIVIVTAVTVRLLFMLWGSSGYYFQKPMPGKTLSEGYFFEGYGIAAGYGYNFYESEAALEQIVALYERVNRDNIRVTPETAGPLSREGVYPMAVHPPGMSLLVAGINRILGVRADVPVQIIGIIFDSTAAVLVCWMGGAFLNARVGFAAGLLYGLFLPLAYQSACAKMPDGLLSVFVAASLACVLKGSQRGGWLAAGWYLGGGLVLGLGCYLRSNYIFMPMFCVLGLWAYTRRFFYSVSAMLLVQVVVLLVLLPWAHRNYRLFGRWIFTSSTTGASLLHGLGEFGNPWGLRVRDSDRHQEARGQGFAHAWEPAADEYFREIFRQSVRQEPIAWVLAIIKRVPLALASPYYWGYDRPQRKWTAMESITDGKDRYEMAVKRPQYIIREYWDRLIMAGFILCGSVCVVVMWIKQRGRRGLVLLLLSPHLYAIIVHVLTVWQSRYVIPSVFCWLIGVGYVWRVRGASRPG